MASFDEALESALKADERFLDENGDLLREAVVNAAYNIDEKLVRILLDKKQPKVKEAFFSEIEKHWVFNINKFVSYIQDKNFLNDSYTQYKNKIGLTIDGKFLRERNEVSLVWPFKDCVLEGGMTKEDQDRKEIFFNETLAQDEIDKLFEQKVLTNGARYTKEGKKKVSPFKRSGDGFLEENLVIKGNNLLALQAIKEQFRGRVKLIYIDPPYNTDSDSFKYNDSFNHSSWLTFMKNRLEAAYDLLSKDGAIFVQIDHHEVGYLNVLLDEIFGRQNKVQIIAVKTASPAGFKTVNPGPIDVTEYILFYTKDKPSYTFKRGYVPTQYDSNYNLFISNPDKTADKWKLVSLSDVVLEKHGIKIGKSHQATAKNAQLKWGQYWKIIKEQAIAEFALENADRVVSVRDPHKPTENMKEALVRSKAAGEKVVVFKNKISEAEEASQKESYLYKGGLLAFYSNKIQEIDGVKSPTILLTDFWNDLSWDGIAKEGGVKLKNGKKPERLLKRIIEVTTEKGDIVMDYHLGSGTTAATALKLGRKFIGVEQMDYGENDSVVRLQNVIKGDESGISKLVKWKGGGDFVYFELKKFNQDFIEQIESAGDTKKLLKVWEEMKQKAFFKHNFEMQKFEESLTDFKALPVAQQKALLLEILDKNQLYVNVGDIDDKRFKISAEDKQLTKEFYGE